MKTQGIQNPTGVRLQKRLYTVPEAAQYLGRSSWAVREMFYAGKIPCVRDGKRMFFDVFDLDAWVEQNKTLLAS